MTGKHLHIWSDIPDTPFASDEPNAVAHASEKPGGIIANVKGLTDLESVFRELIYDGVELASADFHTHGGDGQISLGTDTFDRAKLVKMFDGKGYDALFAENAAISFLGCNVAHGAPGEYFLTEVARVLVGRRGGTAQGETGAGFAFTPGNIHLFGRTVIAHAKARKCVKLENPRYLHTPTLKKRISSAESNLARYGAKLAGEVRTEVAKNIRIARDSLEDPNHFAGLKNASNHLWWVERVLNDARMSALSKYPFGGGVAPLYTR